MAGPIKIAFLGDESALSKSAKTAGNDLKDLGKDAEKASKDISSGVDSAGGSSAKLAGAFGDIAGGLGMIGMGGFGGELEKIAPLLMFAAGAADVFTVANEALNLTFLANPITLVVIAIAALVGGFILAYNKVGWFRDGVNKAFSFIKTLTANVFGTLVDWFTHKIPDAFMSIVRFAIKWSLPGIIIGHIDDIKKVFGGLVGFVTGLGSKIATAGKTVINAFIGIANGIIGGFNGIDLGIHLHLPSWAGGFGFDVDDIVPDIPTIPLLDTGGIVRGPGLVRVGNIDEAMIPLTGPGRPGNLGNGTGDVHLHFDGLIAGDPRRIGKQILDLLRAYYGNGGTMSLDPTGGIL